MKKILIALAIFASAAAASAQTKPAQKKAEAKKECCKAKKECTKEEEDNCCFPGSKAKILSTTKKPAAKKS